MWLVNTFDDFKQYLQMFEGAENIGEFNSLVFKKKTEDLSVYYGLFNDAGELVAYYWLVKFPSQHNMLLGFELRVHRDFQRKGIAMFFYNYIIIEDAKTIVSDYSHNTESSAIWDKLANISMMKVGRYDRKTDSIEWGNLNKELVYGNGHMHFVVAPKTIQDIDVEHAHDVNTSIVINTCKKVKGKFINKPTSTGCFVRATPLSFEL